MLDCGIIKERQEYKYLGIIISQDGTCDKQAQLRTNGYPKGKLSVQSSRTGIYVEQLYSNLQHMHPSVGK